MKFSHVILTMLITMSLIGQEKFEIPLSNPGAKGKLHIDIKYGPIQVTGTDRSDVLITYQPTHPDEPKVEEVEGGLKKISGGSPEFEIREHENVVSVESSDWSRGMRLVIEVPKEFDLDLNSYNNGDIEVSTVYGNHNIESFNGHIKAERLRGAISATTYNGKIEVVFEEITTDVPMAFSNYTGGIDITVPAKTKASLKLKSKQGEIYSGFDIDLKNTRSEVKEDERGKGYKLSRDNWIVGKINSGGPVFTIQNLYGDIYIRKAE